MDAASSNQAKPKAVVSQTLTGLGIFAGILNQKKRKLNEMSGDGCSNLGRFMYKFKEGHSKNFKRELTFDYFL
jgi:hypothetical protein